MVSTGKTDNGNLPNGQLHKHHIQIWKSNSISQRVDDNASEHRVSALKYVPHQQAKCKRKATLNKRRHLGYPPNNEERMGMEEGEYGSS